MNGYQVETLPAARIDAELAASWEALRREWPAYASPFFAPEYTRLVGQLQPQAEVGVVFGEGRLLGIFPFQRTGRLAQPIGGGITDFQGIVMRDDTPFPPCQLLRACELDSWEFRYLARGWSALEKCRFRRLNAPAIRLSDGFATFEQDLDQRGSDLLPKSIRGLRTLAKRVGPVRFELDSRSPACLKQLLQWKAEQHERTNTLNGFQPDWVRQLLDRIFTTHEPTFAGLISTLYAGDQLVAGALNLRSGSTLHVWLTAFNREFSKFSPGLLCMVELVRAAAADGVTRVDLGHGDEPYKYRFGTLLDEVAEGCVDCRWLAGWARRSVYQARQYVLDSRLRPWLQEVKQQGRRLRACFWSPPAREPSAPGDTENGS
ncbi:MAG: GNAT family N-acetyltransferase [Pirellulales bacterium]